MVNSTFWRPNWLAAALLLLTCPAWAISQLQATIDRNPVVVGQSVELTLIADDNISSQLDLSPLEQDFEVHRTNVSHSTQIINFDRRTETRWHIVLLPKRVGELTIGAITVDGVSSNPITVRSLAKGEQASGQLQPVSLQASLNTKQLWLGQPATLTVKLMLAADLQRGSLTAPEHSDVQIQQLGQDQTDTQIVDGRRVQVITRTYVLSPQRSGELTLGPVTFEGDLLIGGSNGFFNSGRTRTFALNSDPIALTVKPQPSSYQGQWLAADLVTLQADDLANQQFEVGQPITLNLNLTAVGTVAEALPTITLADAVGFRAYPDKPQRSGGTQSGQLLARLNQSIALVPQQAGQLTIPEVRVPWWNTRTNRQEWATLPAQTIEVKASANAAPVTIPAAPVAAVTPTPSSNQAASPLWKVLTGLFASLWLLTLYWGWRRGAAPAATATTERPSQSQLQPQLLKACANNDAVATLNLLPQWASEQCGQHTDLTALKQLQPQMATEIDLLQQLRYGSDQGQWQGQALAQLIRQSQWQQRQKNNQLASLNPV